MKNIQRLFALLLSFALVTALCGGGFAAETQTADVLVRVNGSLVEFPDGQPYVDEHYRTMIPVRFVTEALGAKVDWNNDTRSAVIEKNGITVIIPIGSDTLTVTKDGVTSTVKMDTAAVAKDGRTYVPIRFVAEALGAYVDYASDYKTVGIYQDALTPAQIEKLQAYAYTQPEDGGYARGLYLDRLPTGSFANARELLFHMYSPGGSRTAEESLAKSEQTVNTVLQAAKNAMDYDSERVTIRFLADASCVYQPDVSYPGYVTVRGIVAVTTHVNGQKLNAVEHRMVYANLGINPPIQDVTMYVDLDLHMNNLYNNSVNTYTPLSEPYT